MANRLPWALKILCVALAGVVALQVKETLSQNDSSLSLTAIESSLEPLTPRDVGKTPAKTPDKTASKTGAKSAEKTASKTAAKTASKTPTKAGAKTSTAVKSAPPKSPSKFAGLSTSGVFGARAAPRPVKPPVLTGIFGDTVIVRMANKKEAFLKIGGKPVNGIQLLEIATNRVVIELQGQKFELVQFGGIGSAPLLKKTPPQKGKTK